MRGLRPGTFWVLSVCCVAGVLAWSQIIPGKLPPGPPPQPGQLAPEEASKPTPEQKPKESAPAADDKPTFDQAPGEKPLVIVTTRQVVVPTTVFDPSEKEYVTGLKSSDFEVYDNDKPQKVGVELIEQPMSVVLAIQANAEVESFLPKLKKSANLLHGLVTGENGDMAILAFDHRMQLLQDFTSDPDKLDDAMQHLRAGSNSSALIDAVVESDHMLRRHDRDNKRRRVIILISRDVNKGSEAKLNETVRDMQFDNITVYPVDISQVVSALTKGPGFPRPAYGNIPPEAMPAPIAGGGGMNTGTTVAQNAQLGNALELVPPMLRSIHDLFKKPPARAFAYFTGGVVFNFATDRGLEKAIAQVGKDINSQYILSYTLTAETMSEPGFHNIVVKVDRPGLKIRTRPGYWWGGGQID